MLSARLARGRARLTLRSDQAIEVIAALCGTPAGRLPGELADATARDARGDCVC